jgi:hypothetical protein
VRRVELWCKSGIRLVSGLSFFNDGELVRKLEAYATESKALNKSTPVAYIAGLCEPVRSQGHLPDNTEKDAPEGTKAVEP